MSFAADEHRRVGLGCSGHFLQKHLQCRAGTDHLLEIVFLADFFLQVDVLGLQAIFERFEYSTEIHNGSSDIGLSSTTTMCPMTWRDELNSGMPE